MSAIWYPVQVGILYTANKPCNLICLSRVFVDVPILIGSMVKIMQDRFNRFADSAKTTPSFLGKRCVFLFIGAFPAIATLTVIGALEKQCYSCTCLKSPLYNSVYKTYIYIYQIYMYIHIYLHVYTYIIYISIYNISKW